MAEENPIPRLLAIDDSELIHRLLETRLQGERLELHGATSSEDGLKKSKSLKPEVILLDIALDGMNGFELLEKLKEDPETRNIAVIFISATGEPMDRVKGLDMGATSATGWTYGALEQTIFRSANDPRNFRSQATLSPTFFGALRY